MSKVDTTYPKKRIKHELINDSFQNRSCYNIPKAQLVIADIPYNLANNMYASNPSWYEGGDSKNGESKLAGKQAFYSDNNFNLVEYMHFCNKCGFVSKDNRQTQSKFCCQSCGFEENADINAARNILERGLNQRLQVA